MTIRMLARLGLADVTPAARRPSRRRRTSLGFDRLEGREAPSTLFLAPESYDESYTEDSGGAYAGSYAEQSGQPYAEGEMTTTADETDATGGEAGIVGSRGAPPTTITQTHDDGMDEPEPEEVVHPVEEVRRVF